MARQTKGRIFKASSGVFHVEYTHAGKRVRKSLGEKTERKARKKADNILAPFRAASEVERRKLAVATLQTAEEKQQLAELESNFIELKDLEVPKTYSVGSGQEKDLKPSSLRANESLLAGFLKFMKKSFPAITYAKEVTEIHANKYQKKLKENELSEHTFNLRLDIASKAFLLAKLPDPFKNIKRRAKKPLTRQPLTVEQAKMLCTDAKGELRRLYALLIYTGLRVGDCALMQWKSLENGRITRNTAKTGSKVSFPAHPELLAVLNEVPTKKRKPGKYICPTIAENYNKEQSSVSRMIIDDMADHKLDTSITAAGRKRAVPQLGAHSFRHLFGRTMAKAAVPISAVQKWLGHSSPMITQIYSELSPMAVESEIINALPSIAKEPAKLIENNESERLELIERAKSGDIELVKQALAVFDFSNPKSGQVQIKSKRKQNE